MSESTPQPAASGSRTNTMSIVALILAIFLPLVGAILGHVAMGQIKKTGEEGRGLALAAIIVGWSFTAIGVLAIVLTVLPLVLLGSAAFMQ